MSKICLKKENIFLKQTFADKESAFKFFSEHLTKQNKVIYGFEEALLKREHDYPTGLLVGDINVAIPHADCNYVKSSEIILCTLDSPISFNRMDEPKESIDVSVIVLLAIDSPDGHIKALQKIVELIQNQKIMNEILSSDNKNDVMMTILNECIK